MNSELILYTLIVVGAVLGTMVLGSIIMYLKR